MGHPSTVCTVGHGLQASVLLELEAERAGLRQRAEARRTSLVERRQQRAAAAHEGRDGAAAGAGAGAEEDAAEDHEVLEGERRDVLSGWGGAPKSLPAHHVTSHHHVITTVLR